MLMILNFSYHSLLLTWLTRGRHHGFFSEGDKIISPAKRAKNLLSFTPTSGIVVGVHEIVKTLLLQQNDS
jgi:hypothetical protein